LTGARCPAYLPDRAPKGDRGRSMTQHRAYFDRIQGRLLVAFGLCLAGAVAIWVGAFVSLERAERLKTLVSGFRT
jgi:hypothetical protein